MHDEQWCRSHHPGLPRSGGAPVGNRNAQTHGLYARWFSPDERQELSDVAGLSGLTGEISVLRVALARLLADTGTNSADRVLVVSRALDSLGRALRNQRVLDGERSTQLMDALEAVLDELGIGDG